MQNPPAHAGGFSLAVVIILLVVLLVVLLIVVLLLLLILIVHWNSPFNHSSGFPHIYCVLIFRIYPLL